MRNPIQSMNVIYVCSLYRITSNIILEDASSSEVDYNSLISGQTYDVAKFVPDILANFFQENYSLFPEVQESNRRPT